MNSQSMALSIGYLHAEALFNLSNMVYHQVLLKIRLNECGNPERLVYGNIAIKAPMVF